MFNTITDGIKVINPKDEDLKKYLLDKDFKDTPMTAPLEKLAKQLAKLEVSQRQRCDSYGRKDKKLRFYCDNAAVDAVAKQYKDEIKTLRQTELAKYKEDAKKIQLLKSKVLQIITGKDFANFLRHVQKNTAPFLSWYWKATPERGITYLIKTNPGQDD